MVFYVIFDIIKNMETKSLVKKFIFEKDLDFAKKIKEMAEKNDIWFDSTQKLYEAMAQEKITGFSVPAVNIRTLTFDTAKTAFRLMKEKNVGICIFELARSESKYTDQTMSEYAIVIMAAAIEENYSGPIFIQNDHCQIKADKFFNPDKKNEEIASLKSYIRSSVESGVYNVDIDASTLVRPSETALDAQQHHNYTQTAEFTEFIRSIEPSGITISIGGEIGEIGGKNSTPEEFEAFINGYKNSLPKEIKGIIKVSVQTGASHGGIILNDGTRAETKIDLDVLEKISKEAKKYDLAGTVQHGASTLSENYFDLFPKKKCVEVHLATIFQDVVYDNLQKKIKEKMYDWCRNNCPEEKAPGMTDEQFLMKARKKALGPFKKELWDLPESELEKIKEKLKEKFSLFFEKLGVCQTADKIREIYKR